MKNPPIKIAYLCDISPVNAWSYSGGNTRMYDALRKHVGDVTILDDSWHSAELVRKLLKYLPAFISFRAKWRLHVIFSKLISKGVAKELAREDYDVLFCTYSFHSLLNLNLPYPMLSVFSSDATPTTYKQSEIGASFGSYLTVSRLLDPFFFKAEKEVYGSTALLLWPSHWLKKSADQAYDLNEAQSRVVPWGANITDPGRESLSLGNPIDGKVQLLILGRDWFAKGGPITFEVLGALLERGIDAHLTVIGCVPPEHHTRDEMTIYEHLDKKDPKQFAVFEDVLKQSHFLVMPSYESYGFAFCEASAYGLPSLCLRIGGVPVYDGENGHALPADATPKDFVKKIEYYIANPGKYLNLRATSRKRYEDELNWDAWGEEVRALVVEKLPDAKRQD